MPLMIFARLAFVCVFITCGCVACGAGGGDANPDATADLGGDAGYAQDEKTTGGGGAIDAGPGVVEYGLPTPGASPLWITAGPDGNLWFTEDPGNQIGRITPAGVITEFVVPTKASRPYAITAGPDGNVWFTEQAAGQIGRITPTGSVLEFAVPSGVGQPQGITSGPDGNLWVAVGVRLARVTPDGVFTCFPPASEPVPVSGTLGEVTAGPDGNLWFTEMYGNAIGRMSPSGAYAQFVLPNASSVPRGITAGPDGNLWFTEEMTDKIGRITPSGDIVEFAVASAGMPTAITRGLDGNLWFTDPGVGRITPAGSITLYSGPSFHGGPFGIAAGTDGGIWFTKILGKTIARIVP